MYMYSMIWNNTIFGVVYKLLQMVSPLHKYVLYDMQGYEKTQVSHLQFGGYFPWPTYS